MESNSRDYLFFNLSEKERFLIFLAVSYCRFECCNSKCKSLFGYKLFEFNLIYNKMLSLLNLSPDCLLSDSVDDDDD